MQIARHYEGRDVFECSIPDSDAEILPGIYWGDAGVPFTAAYWRFSHFSRKETTSSTAYKLGTCLREEVIACLLGGHGIKAEIGVLAYNRLRSAQLIEGIPPKAAIESSLEEPFLVNGRLVRYRFPCQKARYIYDALSFLDDHRPPPGPSRELRNWLLNIPGVGNKTASWITRNYLDASDVAIIDIHIHRAGVLAGIFKANDNSTTDYSGMESIFLQMAKTISVPANVLDHYIWHEFRTYTRTVRNMLVQRGVKATDRCGLPPANNSRTTRNRDLFRQLDQST